MAASLPFAFTADVLAWIAARPPGGWRPATKEYGDRSMEDDDYLLIQRSQNMVGAGLTIQAIGIRERHRRHGHTRYLLKRIEEAARARGLAYVLLQSIMGDEMLALAESAGYAQVPNGGADYIKRLV
jgi:GNAT superfamily N-acetyltransferase